MGSGPMRTNDGVGGCMFGVGSKMRGGPADTGEGQMSIAGTGLNNFLGSG